MEATENTTTTPEVKNKCGFFTDINGNKSMRRFLSFICCLFALINSTVCIFMETDWKMAVVLIGLPLTAALIFMFFTSWESIAKVAEAVKR